MKRSQNKFEGFKRKKNVKMNVKLLKRVKKIHMSQSEMIYKLIKN